MADENPAGELVTLNGQTFRVPKDMADALSVEMQPKTQPVQNESVEDDSGDPGEFDDEFWSNPKKVVMSAVKDYVGKSEQRMIRNYNAQMKSEKAENEFFTGFYQKNPHLKPIDRYIKSVANDQIEKLKTYNGDQVKIANYLADAGNKLMSDAGKKIETSEVFVEGESTPSAKVSQEDQTEKILGLGDVIKKRRAARRKARTGG